MNNLPWYKHLWPWLLMSGPAVVVVASLVSAVIAFRSFEGQEISRDSPAPAKPSIIEARNPGG
jgi:hypothetical protein